MTTPETNGDGLQIDACQLLAHTAVAVGDLHRLTARFEIGLIAGMGKTPKGVGKSVLSQDLDVLSQTLAELKTLLIHVSEVAMFEGAISGKVATETVRLEQLRETILSGAPASWGQPATEKNCSVLLFE